MAQRNKIGMWMLALTVAALTPPFLMFSQIGKSQKMPNLDAKKGSTFREFISRALI